jgi:hypothetical protein
MLKKKKVIKDKVDPLKILEKKKKKKLFETDPTREVRKVTFYPSSQF